MGRRSWVGWVALLAAGSAAAQDAFEIQVYNSQTAPAGQVGAELHLNHFLVGSRSFEGEVRPTNHVTHLTIEPHVGLADWCEAGAYLSFAVRADGTFDYAGIKLRFKARVPRKVWGVVGLSLNQELSATRADYEEGEFAWEIRPVIDVDWKRLYFSANPIVAIPLGGAQNGQPEFEPALKLAVRVLPFLAVGAEYFAALGPIARPDPPSAQTHRLFGALDFEWESGRKLFELNLGVGYGFVGPERWIAKVIFAVDLAPPLEAPPSENKQ